jgi:hypothetical protein
MMRGLFVISAICALFVSADLLAEAPADWQRVKMLPPHTKVHIDSEKMKRTCSIDSVTDDSLSCSSGNAVSSFQRSEIKSIKGVRRLRSTLGGAAIGAGVGFIVGFAAAQGQPKDSFIYFAPAAVGGVIAVMGAVPGAAIGAPTDFLRGPTVYQVPKP